MVKSRRSPLLSLVLAAALLPVNSTSARDDVSATAGDGAAVQRNAVRVANVRKKMSDRITQADREAAARNLKALKARLEATKKAVRAQQAAEAAANGMSFALETPPGVNPPGPGDVPDYFTTANWAFSPPLRKFVDTLPGLGAGAPNNLGNYIPVAVPDTTTYPGSDYYEIWLEEYTQQLHSDLPPTRLRGYRQVNGPSPEQKPLYLGPVIVAQRDRPVRLLFRNKLPAGSGGDLFVPVDESVMGAGLGPLFADGTPCDPTPPALESCAKFPQNRAAIHLHGGRTPWISDGTPHQWIVPALDEANPLQPYKKGVSYENVPDMPDPGPGAMTYFFSNQQSARLMFYHDHAWGITRLNVLVGEAAGYLVTDQWEQQLVSAGALPADQIPLIIQDRTFVDPDTVRVTDPTWNWGSGTPDANGIRPPVKGDLWIPHVYVPAQNPYDQSGANPYGRWVYGPWFFPPTNNILHGPVPNPYHDPACSSTDPVVFATCTTPGQPPVIPGTPIPSVGMEAFLDTAVVNGTAFPRLEVEPKAYRFRILNAASDRFMNLSIYEADPTVISSDGRPDTEVRMVDAAAANFDLNAYPLWPTDGREGGVPDPTTMGPDFIQVGTESGFMPRPVVVRSQPIGYFTDPTVFNVGNVKDKGLLLGPAERADVVIDFRAFAGKTLILYNDAPAAFPARDARVDYYAGAPDLSDSGGHWGPQPGFGPNTRTLMQIKVAAAPLAPAPFSLATLEAAMAPDLAAQPAPRPGIFEASQDPILVGQAAYNGVYTNPAGTDFIAFPSNWPAWGYARISDQNIQFKTVGGTLQTFPLEPKGIHDEMGAAFDMEYGRMSGNLGISIPFAQVGVANFTLYDFTDPATEVLTDAVTPLSPVLGDGTQIWKISQNGVDTHPIHFHVFDVQLLNRVGWDGLIRPPDENELGWKETVRISPLEDTIVAMRMWAPQLPFGVPNSLRPLNPAIPIGSGYGFTNIDPITQQPKVPADVNRVEDFGWEYVWHCHILSHEEMDMMRPVVLNVEAIVPAAPGGFAVTQGAGGVDLAWTDPTPVDYLGKTFGWGLKTAEIGFRIERAEGPSGAFSVLFNQAANRESYQDTSAVPGTYYRYRVIAYNAAGSASTPVVALVPAGAVEPATSVALTATPATTPYLRALPTATEDGSVTFHAVPTGGVGLFEYRFTLDAVTVQDWSGSESWVMPATQQAGVYTVGVEVRTSTGEVAPPAATLPYEVASNPAATLVVAPPLLAPSPHIYGTSVLFTATATGGAAGKEYRFLLKTGAGAPVVVRDWAAGNTWTMPAATLPDTFEVTAEVRTDLSPSGLVSHTIPYVVKYAAATGLTLGASKASPAVKTIIPSSILFTASATGSQGYRYRFELFDGTTSTEVQPWGTASTWTMPASTPVGSYVVTAQVTTQLGPTPTADRTALRAMVLVYRAATGLTLSASPATRQNPGTPVVFTAFGAGSAGYHYRFRQSTNGVDYVTVRDFSPANTYTLTGAPEGIYSVIADVWADASTHATAEASSPPVTVSQRLAPPATVTLTPDRPSPAGANVVPVPTVFSASATGSSGYQYRFWLRSGAGAFVLQQDYGVGSTWTLPESTPIGTYQVKVDVRTSALVDLDSSTTVNYQLVAPTMATGVQFTKTPTTSPSLPGVDLVFTAVGTGALSGVSPMPATGYQYRFWLNTGSGWAIAQDYGGGSTFTITAPASATYQVSVHVRTTTTSAVDVSSSVLAQVVSPPPPTKATGVTLSASPRSPSAVGTSVVFTAVGSGSTTDGLPSAPSAYSYRFFLNTGTGWNEAQAYGVGSTYTLVNPPVGTYLVAVHVRTSTTVPADVYGPSLMQSVTTPPPTPATGVSVAATPGSPSAAGTDVVFQATGLGSLTDGLPTPQSTYQFRFWRNDGTGWVMVQDYGVGSAYTLVGPTARTYQIAVHVRTRTTVAADYYGPTKSHLVQ